MTEAEQRARVIQAATGWLRTPFHDEARVKGVGVDCAQLLAAVYHEAGIVGELTIPHYSAQQFLHDDAEKELMASIVLMFAREIDEAQVKGGDVVLYKVARAYAHAAIIVDWPHTVIHAHKLSGMVLATPAFAYDMDGRKTRFFSCWGS
jgi:cell wall-associated NlpC family hydrolase